MSHSKTLTPRKLQLDQSPKFERFDRAELPEDMPPMPPVEKGKGMFNAGIMHDVVVVTIGEALGHGMWLDDVFATQVLGAINAAKMGLKSRFTHPGMSSDGLGKHLGRVTNARMRGTSVIADLHFTESSHSTPDGDLAGYVELLTKEDPTAAGLSIVFEHDRKAETQFLLEHGAEIVDDPDWGQCIDCDDFESPDPNNVENYPHARLGELRAVDVVDEPAANPDGMFSATPIVNDATEMLSYVLGITTKKPAGQLFGVDADRASQFVTRFLSTKGLSIVSSTNTTADPVAETDPTTNPPATPPAAQPESKPADGTNPATEPEGKPADEQLSSRAAFNAELSKFTSKFGADNGTKWFTEGKTYEEALSLHCDAQAAQIAELSAKLKDTEARLSQVKVGTDPLPTAGLSAEQNGKPKNLGAMTNPENAVKK